MFLHNLSYKKRAKLLNIMKIIVLCEQNVAQSGKNGVQKGLSGRLLLT